MTLQVAIFATGNYTFFNFLSFSFLVLVLDDYFWLRYVIPTRFTSYILRSLGPKKREKKPLWWRSLLFFKSAFFTGVLAFVYVATIAPFFGRRIFFHPFLFFYLLVCEILSLIIIDIKLDDLTFITDAHAMTQPYMIANRYFFPSLSLSLLSSPPSSPLPPLSNVVNAVMDYLRA